MVLVPGPWRRRRPSMGQEGVPRLGWGGRLVAQAPVLSKKRLHARTHTHFLSQAFAAFQYAQTTDLKPRIIVSIQGSTMSPLSEGLGEAPPQMHGEGDALS